MNWRKSDRFAHVGAVAVRAEPFAESDAGDGVLIVSGHGILAAG